MSTEKTPLENGLECYVGLEHLDPDDLKIKRWGFIKEGTSFTKKFEKGQVLFGKRRVYLHKTALAEFDGLCSGDILVFDVKNERLLPEFLPFLVQSDDLFDFAMDTSAGSLSPRTKWKHLANFEFPLPSKEEQKNIAEILWAVERSIRKKDEFLEAAETYKNVLMKHLFTYGPVSFNEINKIEFQNIKNRILPAHWEVTKLKKCVKTVKGKKPDNIIKEKSEKSLPYLTAGYFRTDQINDFAIVNRNIIEVDKDDIVLIWDGSNAGEVFSGLKGVLASTMVKINPKENKITKKFLFYYLKTKFELLNKTTNGSAIPHIDKHFFENLLMPVPPIDEQLKIASILFKLDQNIEATKKHKEHLNNLKKRLLNDLLSGKKRLRGAN